MVVISLGTNLGNRLDNLNKAVSLMKHRCLSNLEESIILETEAIVPDNAPSDWNKPYLNMIIKGETTLSPRELLSQLKSIEREIGRPEFYDRWSPRIIDLDILFYNNITIKEPDLIIPHLEIKNRPFFIHLLKLMGINLNYSIQDAENSFIKSYILHPQLVGIINITEDSFSDGGKYYNTDEILSQINHLNEAGASIIELGAQSTKNGAIIQSLDVELSKLEEVLNQALPIINKNKIKISIDTFRPEIALKLIQKYPIYLINDVKGSFDDNSLKEILKSQCHFCCTHSLSAPVDKNQVIPIDADPILYVKKWGEKFINRIESLGFSSEQLILDPGIGFGKNSYQSIYIMRNIDKLKQLNCKIMVGHSRKSYIRSFVVKNNAADRDIETVAISQVLANNIDFLRVHNIEAHMRALVASKIIK